MVTAHLDPIRERTNELLQDKGELTRLLKIGSEKAAAVADETVRKVYDAVGLIPRG